MPGKRVEVRYNEEEGLWHVILINPDGDEADVAAHCEEYEAEDAANAINRFAQE